MASTKDIKRRQKSVKNTNQVTKAMELVSASKMRKSQLVALRSRPYAEKSLSILARIKERQPDIKNIYLDGPEAKAGTVPALKQGQSLLLHKKVLAVVVTSDKGLCGGLNASVIKESAKIFEEYKKAGKKIELLLVGMKSKNSFEKAGFRIIETYKGAGDYIQLEDVIPIARAVQDIFKKERFDEVIAVYTEFVSTLKQKIARRKILPITKEIFRDLIESITPEAEKYSANETRDSMLSASSGEYIFEPSARDVLKNLVPFLINIYIYHIILESNASEHSARMVAMKNASENAESILKELTLSYNKARQAAITAEITEITAGANTI